MKKIILSILVSLVTMTQALAVNSVSSVTSTVSYKINQKAISGKMTNISTVAEADSSFQLVTFEYKTANTYSQIILGFNSNTVFKVGETYQIDGAADYSSDSDILSSVIFAKKINPRTASAFFTTSKSSVNGTLTVNNISNGKVTGTFEFNTNLLKAIFLSNGKVKKGKYSNIKVANGRFTIPASMINN